MSGALTPIPLPSFVDANGNPYASGHLHTYTTGTSTPAAVHTDDDLTAAHTNPIILDAAGRPPSAIYLGAQSYKFVLEDSLGNVIWTVDPVYDYFLVNKSSYQAAFTTGTAAPVSGAHVTADRVWNSTPAVGGYLGWICVADGTPGTWGSFGFIETTGAAAPSSGAHVIGEVCRNTTPTAGGYMGWVCITSGSPGTWKGFGVIQTP